MYMYYLVVISMQYCICIQTIASWILVLWSMIPHINKVHITNLSCLGVGGGQWEIIVGVVASLSPHSYRYICNCSRGTHLPFPIATGTYAPAPGVHAPQDIFRYFFQSLNFELWNLIVDNQWLLWILLIS